MHRLYKKHLWKGEGILIGWIIGGSTMYDSVNSVKSGIISNFNKIVKRWSSTLHLKIWCHFWVSCMFKIKLISQIFCYAGPVLIVVSFAIAIEEDNILFS